MAHKSVKFATISEGLIFQNIPAIFQSQYFILQLLLCSCFYSNPTPTPDPATGPSVPFTAVLVLVPHFYTSHGNLQSTL